MSDLLKLAQEFQQAVAKTRFPQTAYSEMRDWVFSVIATRILFDLDRKIEGIRPGKNLDSQKETRKIMNGFRGFRNELKGVIRNSRFRVDPAGHSAEHAFKINGRDVGVQVVFSGEGGDGDQIVIDGSGSLEITDGADLKVFLGAVAATLRHELSRYL